MTGFDIQRRLADNIRKIRKECNLTQEKLAEMVGISLDTIKFIETCRRWPREDTLAEISNALGADIGELFSCNNGDEIETQNRANRIARAQISHLRHKVETAFDEMERKPPRAKPCRKI